MIAAWSITDSLCGEMEGSEGCAVPGGARKNPPSCPSSQAAGTSLKPLMQPAAGSRGYSKEASAIAGRRSDVAVATK